MDASDCGVWMGKSCERNFRGIFVFSFSREFSLTIRRKALVELVVSAIPHAVRHRQVFGVIEITVIT
jgi:hypothetical protein